jgi:O-antigen ligase
MILAIPIVFIVGLITVYSPIYGLGILSLIFIIHGILIDLIGPSATHLPMYCGIATLLVCLIKKRIHIRLDVKIVLILALICIMFVSTLFSEDQSFSLIDLFNFAKAFLLSVFIYSVISEIGDIRVIAKFILIGALIGAVNIIYQYATDTMTITTAYIQRGASLSADPNDTARLLTLALPMAIYWALHSDRRFFQALNVAGFLCILAGIILTQSRGGFVTLVLIMGILYFKNISLKSTLVAIVLLTCSIFFGAATGYWERVGTLSSLQEQNKLNRDGSLDGRLELVRTGVILFKDNLIIGAGPGQFGATFLDYKSKSSLVGYGTLGKTPAAHNLYLEFAVENGLLGISVLVAILIISLRGFLTLSRNGPDESTRQLGAYLAFSFLAILVSGLFLSGGQNKPLWLMVGLGFAAYNIKRSHELPQK